MASVSPLPPDMSQQTTAQSSLKDEKIDGSAQTPAVDDKPVLIKFAQPDEDNPFNWLPRKKWTTILTAHAFACITAINATAYGEGISSMQSELHCNQLAASSGTTSYLVVCAFAPLLMAPISEQFGRRYMMILSSLIFTICYLPQALGHNLPLIVVFRGIQGAAASAANSLVGGIVADVFPASTRGLPMTMFGVFIFSGQGLGAVIFGWVEMELGFRWIAWIQLILAGIINVFVLLLLVETRGSTILTARALRLTIETGKSHAADIDSGMATLSTLEILRLTAARPIIFLTTEPLIIAMSTWAALVWGVCFLMFSSIPLVYAQYGFSTGETGSVLICAILASVFGFFLGSWQDKMYTRDARRSVSGHAPPESRLYGACVGAVLVPVSLFWFAWAGRPHVHWIAPTVAVFFLYLGIFPILLATFSYLADAYEQYGSSAIAAQSLARNVFAGTFPLFTPIMYKNLGYPQASTLLGALAAAFAVLPFLLMAYGPAIRSRSRVAREIALQHRRREEEAEQKQGVSRDSTNNV